MKGNDYILSNAWSAARKTDSLCRARQCYSPEPILAILLSTINPCIGYFDELCFLVPQTLPIEAQY